MPNRLAHESSPYLQQHADNPVDWYPWGEEAFARARTEDRPVLLSIGYSACHWCHVMAHESFEDPAIAGVMNDLFVNIKVDREERPDVDSVYMEAVQAMTGSGGWPLTVFLTPEGRPFYGGTYFPPTDKRGMPGFPRVLQAVADAYRARRGEVEATARQMEAAIRQGTSAPVSGGLLTAETLSRAYTGLLRHFDRRYGGFGRAPKFPQPLALEFMLRYFRRQHDATALDMVATTLEGMARGGIYDHVGGGFHRYSTDAAWLVPHFEKMLYDNALLARTYLHAYLVTGRHLFRYVAEKTLDYILREMRDPAGGFYSSQDADSEGQEGKYYLWTLQEIEAVLGDREGRVFSQTFGVTAEGNFEGRNILHIVGDSQDDTSSIIEQAKDRLLRHRERRAKPGRDEKVLSAWNGLTLAALAEAAAALPRHDYLEAAQACGDFLLTAMAADGPLLHTYRDGAARIEGYLQDYALVIEGLLALHAATSGGRWLRRAIALGESMVERFWDKSEEAFYDTGPEPEGLFVRPRSVFDGAMPSGPSAATLAILKLANITGREDWARLGASSLGPMAGLMQQQPLGFGGWLCALDFYLSNPREVVIVGPTATAETAALRLAAAQTWLPEAVVVAHDPEDPQAPTELPLLKDRPMRQGRPTAYVCSGYACQEPVTDPQALERQLRSL